MFIYYPINLRSPISNKKTIYFQNFTYNGFPDILVELHDDDRYVDLGDSSFIAAAITNTDLKTSTFSGNIKIVNPHRGQIKFSAAVSDFSMVGINTITVRCFTAYRSFSFQFTVFVESISKDLADALSKPHVNPTITASDVVYDNTGSGLQSANVQDAIDELKSMQQIIDRKEIVYVLFADKWIGDTYRVEDEAIFTDSDVFIGAPKDMTDAQYEALAYANIIPASVETGCVMIQALKDIPTIDIPVSVVIKTLRQG